MLSIFSCACWPSVCLLYCFLYSSTSYICGGLPFPPVDHILSELSAMTHLSWMALHGMAHSFNELHKPFRHKAVMLDSINEHELGKTLVDGEGQGGVVCYSP